MFFKKNRLKWLLIFSISLAPAAVMAQSTITGKVISQADTKPVPHASVFLSNATIGTTTADDGTFVLKNIMPGKYNLVVSILGFDEDASPLVVTGRDITLPVITLYPKTLSLNSVTISAKRSDPQWIRLYDKFKAAFLGPTDLARDCKILNPGVMQLQYDEQKDVLTASSSDFLEIENTALGYKIKYLLKEFVLDNSTVNVKSLMYHGYTFFEPMSGTAGQERQWKKSRASAYEGSQMHFLRTVAANAVDKEGFRVLRLPVKGDGLTDTVVYFDKKSFDAAKQKQALPVATGPDKEGIYALLNNNDRLYISYNKNHRYGISSYTRLNAPGNTLVDFTGDDALFDANGALLSPRSIVYDGAWARVGVANLLPVNYDDESIKKVFAGPRISGLVKKLKIYADSIKAEKAYLQFDKPYYALGDTIYFKAYVTGGGNGPKLSDLSGILNVDLINPSGKITNGLKLRLENGTGRGDFALADTLKDGNYRIRAYTNWMRNSGDDAFFETIIPVGGLEAKRVPEGGAPLNAKTASPKKTTTGADVQFLPEGGNLVAGNYSNIAFKAVNPDGSGATIKGTVTDDAGNEVCKFASAHLGMGIFNMVPQKGKKYFANIDFAGGATRTVPLPNAVDAGYTLIVNADADTIRLRVAAAEGAVVNNLSIIAESGGTVCYAAEAGAGNRLFSAVIAKSRFPLGVARFTLFSAAGEPLNERLVFINKNEGARLDIAAKNTYAPREKVTLQLKTSNEGQPASGNYSVSVIDEGKVTTADSSEATIISHLLLSAELHGNIEQPGYYFTNTGEKTTAALDLVMLTHGYRRFEWKHVLGDEHQLPAYPPERTLTISGVIKKGSKPVPGALVKLFGKGADALLLDTVADAAGSFVFNNLHYGDNAKFVIQARTAKGDKDVDVEPDKPATPGITAAFLPTVHNNDAALAFYVLNSRQQRAEQIKYGINQHAQMLKEVTVKDKKITHLEHSQNLNGAGHADQVITSDWLENSGFTTLWDAMRAKAQYVSFRTDNHMIYSSRTLNGEPMVVVIDGTPVQNSDYKVFGNKGMSIKRGPLDDIEVNDTESIEVILGANGGAIYGNRGAGGLVIVTTKWAKAPNNYYKEAPGVIVYKGKGFYKAREFYSPQYDNPHTNPKMTDLRSTIYWNPNIITDKDGKATFSYFNADGKGTYRVVIEGIDADGNLGRQVLRYKVE